MKLNKEQKGDIAGIARAYLGIVCWWALYLGGYFACVKP